ncbi:universal stress protein [Cognatishimia sp. WU-CL00825]|uniref:universal stress protein n=1 Tax=Cognatishimia sp. WU-CL00825 TaxID=3127658 RepID=UPI00310BD023
MNLRNILVAFNGSDAAISALRYAKSLAGDQAHVTALLAHTKHEVVDSRAAWVPASARDIITQANSDILNEIETRFNALKAELDLGERLHFQRRAGRVDAVLSESARSYDILIVGQDQDDAVDSHVSLHPDRIALMSGRPVLIVPIGTKAPAKHASAVLAWDGGRASARALADWLRLVDAQSKLTVLTVGDQALPRPEAELLLNLKRHDVTASHQNIAEIPGVARALLAYCKSERPNLLVMGAYEHSKFREDFLSGVTARVIRATPIPVLLSH